MPWDVFLRGHLIDTVFYGTEETAESVCDALVHHDGYDPAIVVRQAPYLRGTETPYDDPPVFTGYWEPSDWQRWIDGQPERDRMRALRHLWIDAHRDRSLGTVIDLANGKPDVVRQEQVYAFARIAFRRAGIVGAPTVPGTVW